MSKTVFAEISYVTLHQKRPSDYGAKLTVDGKDVRDKYSLEVGWQDPGEKYGYDTFDYSEFAIKSISATAKPYELLSYQDEPDKDGHQHTWTFPRWTSVSVSDDFTIPYDLDTTSLSGPVKWSTSAKTSIDFGPLSYDGSKVTLGGYSPDQLGKFVLDNLTSFVENGMKTAGFGGLMTSLQNVGAARDMLLNGPIKALNDLDALMRLSSNPNASYADAAALENRIFSTIDGSIENAFNNTVLVPGNATADAYAHQLIRSIGLVGNGVTINGGVGLDLQVGIRGTGITINTELGANFAYAVGGAGDDSIVGQAARNLLLGGAGNDSIRVERGTNYIGGGNGADTIQLNGGKNTVSGGAGFDTIKVQGTLAPSSVSKSADGTYHVQQGSMSATFTGVEKLTFSDGSIDLRSDSALVDPIFYDLQNRDVFATGMRTDEHFASYGWHEGRNPNPYFETGAYLGLNGDVAAAALNPLTHYHDYGWREGRDPSVHFDTEIYLLRNPDVAAAKMDPLEHYLLYGKGEGRSTNDVVGRGITADGFDAEYYLLANADVAKSGMDPRQHYATFGWHEGRDPNAWFDTSAYVSNYADIQAAAIDPLKHYVEWGWREGRDPSSKFNTTAYLQANQDVAAAGMNPLIHYLTYGIYENRADRGNQGSWQQPASPSSLATQYNYDIPDAGGTINDLVSLEAGHRYHVSVTRGDLSGWASSVDLTIVDALESNFVTTTRIGVPSDPNGDYTGTYAFTASVGGPTQIKLSADGDFGFRIDDITNSAPLYTPIVEQDDFGSTRDTALDLGAGFDDLLNWRVSGAVAPGGDHDMIAFYANEGSEIRISGTNGGPLFGGYADGLDISVYGGDGSFRGGTIGGLTNGTPAWTAPNDGYYYVDIYSFNGAPSQYQVDIFL